jgi:hypothetical protein
VHGEEGNVVFSMASQYGLLMDSLINYDIERFLFIDSSGNIINRKTSEELYGIYDEIFSSIKTDLVNYTGSLGDYFNHKYVGVFTFLSVDLLWLTSYLLHDNSDVLCFQNVRKIKRYIKNCNIFMLEINSRMNQNEIQMRSNMHF